MYKKILAIVLCVLIVSMFLVACGNTGDTPSSDSNVVTTKADGEETEPIETEPERIMPDLPDMDFEGRTFKVLGRTNTSYSQFINFEIDAEGLTGDLVNDAVYQRNDALEEQYNVVIEQDLIMDPHLTLDKLINAGDSVYDLAFIRIGEIGSRATKNFFYNLNDIAYLDFDKPWWNHDANTSLSIGGNLYFTTSDFNMMDKNRTYLLVYNKDMVESYGFGNMYDYVYDGTWTIDKMLGFNTEVAHDIDGDGVMTDSDQWGLGMDSKNSFYIFYNASDNYIITKDNNDIPVISVNNDHTISTIDKLLLLTNDETSSYYCEAFQNKVDYDFWSTASKMFYDNRLLFITTFTHSLKNYSANAVCDYGVLPYPKFDENQEKYLSSPDPVWASLFAVPITVSDTDFSGFMLEALSATSKYDVLPAYYEVSSKTKYMYDEESPKMFDLIFSGLRYDLALCYNWGNLKSLFTIDIPNAGENIFTSKYASLESKAEMEMQNTIDEILK